MNRVEQRNNLLDKYYTKHSVVLDCIKKIKKLRFNNPLLIDFSCGDNFFAYNMGIKHISYDIDPPKKIYRNKTTSLIKGDFLKESLRINHKGDILVGFNPPFGLRNNLAKKFIYKSMKIPADYMFLILLELSSSNGWKFPNYKTILEEKLPKNSFYNIETNKDVNVPCKFFILKRINKESVQEFKIGDLIPRKKRYPKIPNIEIARSIHIPLNKTKGIAVRFAGINAGLDYYLAYKDNLYFIRFETLTSPKYKIKKVNNFLHKVDSGCVFTTIHFKLPITKHKMLELIKYLHKNAKATMNVDAVKYNFTTYDVAKLTDEFFLI